MMNEEGRQFLGKLGVDSVDSLSQEQVSDIMEKYEPLKMNVFLQLSCLSRNHRLFSMSRHVNYRLIYCRPITFSPIRSMPPFPPVSYFSIPLNGWLARTADTT